MGMNLFDGADDDVNDISKIEVNKEFAKRYEHNKKREDLHRLEEMKKKGLVGDSGSDSESDSDSWDEDAVNSTKDEVKLFDALLKIRSKDPALMEKDVKLFESDSESGDEDEGEGSKREKKSKKERLKDVNAKQLIEMGPEFVGSDGEDEDEEDVKKVKTYAEEQEELRKSFVNSLEEAEKEVEDGGDLLRLKPKKDEESEEEDEEINERVDKYFGEDEKLDQDSLFLKEFFKKKMWIDKDEGKTPDDDDIELSEDEEAIEQQEEYERGFNFRFEEAPGDRVQSHSRVVGDSVRKKENVRKEQRKRKKERMEQAELERQEEVKRLKNLKKKEIMEKINRIKVVAGLDDGIDIPLTEADLEEDFDPEKYDKKMKNAFGEEYYDAEDANSDFGSDLEKPDFENEDKLLGLPEDWDVCKPGEGFKSEREKYLQTLEKHEGEADENQIEEDEEEPSEGKRKRKRKMSLKQKISLDEDLEELYKLDYEDTIGDLKTRFKYKTVTSNRHGLSADEILGLDDKELNEVVSIKKIAPYREKEHYVPHTKLMALKKKKKEKEIDEKRHAKDEGKKHKKRKTDEGAGKEQEQRKDDSVALSRKEKKKLRKAEIDISESRLMAYGVIPSKSKGKSKQ